MPKFPRAANKHNKTPPWEPPCSPLVEVHRCRERSPFHLPILPDMRLRASAEKHPRWLSMAPEHGIAGDGTGQDRRSCGTVRRSSLLLFRAARIDVPGYVFSTVIHKNDFTRLRFIPSTRPSSSSHSAVRVRFKVAAASLPLFLRRTD